MGPNEVNTAINKQAAHIRQLNDELAQMHRQQDGAAACIGLKLRTEWVSAQLEHERCCNTTVEQQMDRCLAAVEDGVATRTKETTDG
jgi:hypothetical protein